MRRKIKFTPTADEQYSKLEKTPSRAAIFEQVRKDLGFDEQYSVLEKAPSKAAIFERVRKALGVLEVDPHQPSLNTHEFTSLTGANGEKVFEAYAQNNTPGAYRIFGHYGPDEIKGKERTPVITIVAITRHP